MRKIIIWLFLMFPLLVFAQASGQQIKRPTKVKSSKQSHWNNGNTKQTPIVDIRPRTIPVGRTSIVGNLPWTLLSIEVLDNCTKFLWSVSTTKKNSLYYNNIFVKDNESKKKYTVLKVERVSTRNNQIETKKNTPTLFTLVYSALPKGASNIDIFEESLPILGNINVSSKEDL